MINDGKQVFSTDGKGILKEIVYQIYGKNISDNLINVDYQDDNIKITGVIGNAYIDQPTRKNQIIFLNKRNIKNKSLTATSDNAFSGGIGIGKYGFYILNIAMPADYYDVNVHPTKIEVRFKDESTLCKVMYNAIKTTLLNSEFLNNNEKEIKDEYISNEYEFLNNNMDNTKIASEMKHKDLIQRNNQRKIEYKFLGIIFKTYIIVEIKNEIFLIDQHAAHERILYEKIKANYKKNSKNNIQLMLTPEILNLSSKEMSYILHNKRLFENIGFDIELFGKDTVKINGIPDLEYKSKTQNLFLDILDEMITNERTAIKNIEERFIATVACKAAVKANMDLSEQEVHYLISELLMLNNPYTCPHGRPTNIKINLDNLKNRPTL